MFVEMGACNDMDIQIVSLNVGKPRTIVSSDGELTTGIYKSPAPEGPIRLTELNFEGDGQADLVHHGGADKAICVYAMEHYPYWERELGLRLAPGAFGENLTVLGMTENNVCIGDIYAIGDIRLQVTQPRQPCYKLAKKYDLKEMPLRVQNTGFTGFYLRVLQPGMFDCSQPFTLWRRHPAGITVDFANRIKHHDKQNLDAVRTLLAVPELSANWRALLEKRLAGDEPSADFRLQGRS